MIRLDAPCKTCPYRMEVPLGVWHASEFEKLQVAEANPLLGHMFHCHQDKGLAPAERGFCIGWLLDQQRRGTPSIQLRMHFLRHPDDGRQFMDLSDEGLELFPSIEAMCKANQLARDVAARLRPKSKRRRRPSRAAAKP